MPKEINCYENFFGKYINMARDLQSMATSGPGDMRIFGEKYVNSRKAKQNRRKRKKRK